MVARILVVDDDDNVRFTIKYVLERASYRVCVAASTNQALEAFGAFKPDLVITDLIMPGEGGTELIHKLREVAPEIKIVAMSGGARMTGGNILQEALDAGANRTLQKPFQFTELTGVVVNLLGTSQIGSELPQ